MLCVKDVVRKVKRDGLKIMISGGYKYTKYQSWINVITRIGNF